MKVSSDPEDKNYYGEYQTFETILVREYNSIIDTLDSMEILNQ